MKHLQVDGSKAAGVMQAMTDYKPKREIVDLRKVMRPVAGLRADCKRHGFGEGDKLATGIDLRGDGLVKVEHAFDIELTGGVLGNFHYYLTIPFNGRLRRATSVETLHDGLRIFSDMHPGGNVSNVARSTALLMEAGIGPEELHIFGSTDSLFEEWHRSLTDGVRERIRCTILMKREEDKEVQLPSRKALHLPYSEKEVMSISTPATSTIPYLRGLFRELLRYDHVIVSEGLGRSILGTGLKHCKDLPQVFNPGSSFLGDCALDSYEYTTAGGRPPIVTMNGVEFNYYVRCIRGRIEGENPADLDPIPFLSPFADDGMLEQKRADITNKGFREYFRHIRPVRSNRLQFPLSVSLGEDGGYHVAEREGRLFVVFSTTPHTRGAQKLLRIAGKPHGVSTKIRKVMGAGDAVGALLSLANIWDTEEFIAQYASQHNTSLLKDSHRIAAAALFTSILSRYVGEFLYRTEKCDMTQVPADKIRDVIVFAAKQALRASESLWNIGTQAKEAKVEGGMKVALWELRE